MAEQIAAGTGNSALDRQALSALSWFWTPIVAVTAADGARQSGQIAVSAHGASIVPTRPRLTVGLWKTNLTRDLVKASGAFAVHLLRDDQDELVYALGLDSGRDREKLAPLPHERGSTGAPLLKECLTVYECRVVNAMDAGDHTIFLGDVVAALARSTGQPLWWRDLRARMPADKLAAWSTRNGGHVAESEPRMDRIER